MAAGLRIVVGFGSGAVVAGHGAPGSVRLRIKRPEREIDTPQLLEAGFFSKVGRGKPQVFEPGLEGLVGLVGRDAKREDPLGLDGLLSQEGFSYRLRSTKVAPLRDAVLIVGDGGAAALTALHPMVGDVFPRELDFL
jgi:hypothetical protein